MKPIKRLTLLTITVTLILVIVVSSFLYMGSLQNSGAELASIDVAYSPFESMTLFWVAQEQGFFGQNDLNLTLHKYNTGAAALSGVVNGEADIVVGTTEFPLAIQALNHQSVQSIGVMSKSNFIYVIGRTDRGINDVSDLKGKTIGTTFGTIAHYYLGRFLTLNDINIQDVTLVDLKNPIEWVDAVVNGSIDAVATAQPSADLAKDGLGANAVVWSLHSNQPLYAQAIAAKNWIIENPDLCSRFLNALYQAEKFVADHPAEAKAIVKQQMNFSDTYVEKVWVQNEFSLSLDRSLILAMESEARWLIANHLTNTVAVPEFFDYIYSEGLSSVKPESVNLIQ
jgi:ABC-type nitrate/sulfonate/bicarbonate transport system substrate-binding protein